MTEQKQARMQVPTAVIDTAARMAREDLYRRLEQKGYGTLASSHEALGVVTEEYHELVEAVRSGTTREVRAECLDIATACMFAVACIDAGTMDW